QSDGQQVGHDGALHEKRSRATLNCFRSEIVAVMVFPHQRHGAAASTGLPAVSHHVRKGWFLTGRPIAADRLQNVGEGEGRLHDQLLLRASPMPASMRTTSGGMFISTTSSSTRVAKAGAAVI